MGMKTAEAKRFLCLLPAKDAPAAQEPAVEPSPPLSPEDEEAAQVAAEEEQAACVQLEKEAAFRAELSALKLSELKKRARATDGISDDDVEGVDDADDPKAAVIELLVKVAEVIWAQEAKAAAATAAAALIAAEEEAARVSSEEEQAASVKATEAAFRVELSVLKLSELKKRARATDGISDDDVEGVDDADDPKAAVIELLVKVAEVIWAQEAKAALIVAEEEAARVSAEEEQAASVKKKEAALRAELAELKLSELKKRARATDGISDDDVEGVDDADDPKAAVIELLVKTEEAKATGS